MRKRGRRVSRAALRVDRSAARRPWLEPTTPSGSVRLGLSCCVATHPFRSTIRGQGPMARTETISCFLCVVRRVAVSDRRDSLALGFSVRRGAEALVRRRGAGQSGTSTAARPAPRHFSWFFIVMSAINIPAVAGCVDAASRLRGRAAHNRSTKATPKDTLQSPRFLQIRLGSESCDQISASPNRPKRAKSRDKTAGSLFTRVYTLVEFSQTKRCFFSFLKQNIQRQMIHQHHYRLHNTIHISLKTR